MRAFQKLWIKNIPIKQKLPDGEFLFSILNKKREDKSLNNPFTAKAVKVINTQRIGPVTPRKR